MWETAMIDNKRKNMGRSETGCLAGSKTHIFLEFSDLYDFAGKIRTVNPVKGSFCFVTALI